MLKEVEILSGGRAWVRTRLSHERHTAKLAMFVAVLPGRALRAVQSAKARGALDTPEAADALAETDIDVAEGLRGMARAQAETIRLCVHHWDNVHGPDGDDLTFPADVEQLDTADFDALYGACELAISEAGPDPKGTGGASSPSTSAPASSPPESPQA